MSFRGSMLLVVVFYFLNCFHFGDFGDPTAPPSQGPRLFDNVCENCTVSGGFGFASHPTQCNCYFTCVLRRSVKLAYYANPWVSYLRCCPCQTTFSKKLLTCVDYTDKRSDCFDPELGNNPCLKEDAGSTIQSQNPDSASLYFEPLCNGFLECEKVGYAVVPNPSCCEYNKCFKGWRDGCGSCDGACANSRERDCDYNKTPEPTSECPYREVYGSINQFMGVQNMKTYDCAPGTCWDQYTCTCVRTNNTGYDDCLPKAELDFDDGDYTARDGRGNTIWTKTYGYVDTANYNANFSGRGFIGVGGLANTYLSKKFILHFEFSTPYEIYTYGAPVCLVGSCIDDDYTYNVVDTIAITLEYGVDENVDDILNVWLTYKDSKFWLPGADTTETVHLELTAEIEPGLKHEFWLFYGWEEEVYAGIFKGGQLLNADVDDIEGSVQLVPPQSGFLFGHCQKGSDFIGTMDEIEMWTGCKPYDDAEFENAYEEVLDYIAGNNNGA